VNESSAEHLMAMHNTVMTGRTDVRPRETHITRIPSSSTDQIMSGSSNTASEDMTTYMMMYYV